MHPLFRSTNTDGETSHSGSGDEMQLHVEHGGSSFSLHSSNINTVCHFKYLGIFLLLCGGYKEGSSAQIEPLHTKNRCFFKRFSPLIKMTAVCSVPVPGTELFYHNDYSLNRFILDVSGERQLLFIYFLFVKIKIRCVSIIQSDPV